MKKRGHEFSNRHLGFVVRRFAAERVDGGGLEELARRIEGGALTASTESRVDADDVLFTKRGRPTSIYSTTPICALTISM